VLTVGLSIGLQQFCAASLLAGADSSGVWRTLLGLVVLHALQAISVLAGGTITGAGQPRGLLFGGMVGLISGATFLVMQIRPTDSSWDVGAIVPFAVPFIHLILGMFGGMLGTMIWPPPPTINLTTNVQVRSGPTTTSRLFEGPIHMSRVFMGAFVVIAGVVWANAILETVLRAGTGTLHITSHLQARLIGWEIAGLATLFGAGLAGATTINGFKQGLCVGVGASLVLVGIELGGPSYMLETLILMVSSVFTLSLVGGWFGGQLFPPVIARRRRSSMAALD
jgi:hypothetical protein